MAEKAAAAGVQLGDDASEVESWAVVSVCQGDAGVLLVLGLPATDDKLMM